MAYWHAFTVPANTLVTAPAIEVVTLIKGILTEVEVVFPPGPAGMVYLQIYDHVQQMYPREPGQTFRGDDIHVRLAENLPIDGPPWGFSLVGWSPGTVYDHTVYVHFEVTPTVTVYYPSDLSIALPEGLQ